MYYIIFVVVVGVERPKASGKFTGPMMSFKFPKNPQFWSKMREGWFWKIVKIISYFGEKISILKRFFVKTSSSNVKSGFEVQTSTPHWPWNDGEFPNPTFRTPSLNTLTAVVPIVVQIIPQACVFMWTWKTNLKVHITYSVKIICD